MNDLKLFNHEKIFIENIFRIFYFDILMKLTHNNNNNNYKNFVLENHLSEINLHSMILKLFQGNYKNSTN